MEKYNNNVYRSLEVSIITESHSLTCGADKNFVLFFNFVEFESQRAVKPRQELNYTSTTAESNHMQPTQCTRLLARR